MPRSFQGIGPGNTLGRYNRGSVERALTHHFGQGGDTGWTHDGSGGYKVVTGIGVLRLRTLREAWLYVVATQDQTKRLERAAGADR